MKTRCVRPAAPLLAALALLPAVPARAAAPPAPTTPALTSAVPRDPAIRTGTLPNGMAYYIRVNSRPEKRVELRLAVGVGSTAEADDQQGLAHFLEHMNFNGSAHFKPGELIKYLESIGARFGADANAYTSFDETVYELTIPTDRDSLVTRGLEAMSDYAGRALLLDTEIDRERGVVLEEWRLGQGAGNRMRRKQFPVLYHGSHYADRLPIGKPEILEHVPAQRIRDFYRDWYRPENMAIVAVGDFNPDVMEKRIRAEFVDIRGQGPRKPVQTWEVPPHPETLISVAADKEARGSTVAITFKHPRRARGTVESFRENLKTGLFQTMLNQRLTEISRASDAPFLRAFAYDSGLGRTVDTFNMSATTTDGTQATGLKGLVREMERVRRHGFLASELERAKVDLLSTYESAWREKDKTESADFAGQYVGNFLDQEPIPSIDWEYETAHQLVPAITLEEVAGLAKRFIHDDNRVILAQSPEKDGLTPPTEDGLRAALAEATAAPVTPWEDRTAGRGLMDTKPAPGRVVATRVIDEIGVTVWTLSNGVEVWVKPTDFKNDEILFRATALGGASMADPADYQEAANVSSMLGETGFGGFTPVEIEKLLTGKLVSGSPIVGNYTHGLAGSSTPKDLETALQLLYLNVTQPGDRAEGFEVWKKRLATGVANRLASPEAVFSDKARALNSGNFYMTRPLTPGAVDSLRLAPALAFYRKAFANAADFTFSFVGAFKPEELKPLVELYIASLPSTGKATSNFVDRGIKFPATVQKAQVLRGMEPKAQTSISFFADPGRDELEMHRLRVAAAILRTHLREILREELGGTYSVSVGTGNMQPLPGYGTVGIGFGSAPENVDRMVAAVFKEVKRLRDEGPTADDLHKQQEIERRELETSEKQNGYWLGSLETSRLLGIDPKRIAHRRERIDLLTVENLHAAFQKYFPLDRYTQVSLLPANGATGINTTTPGGK